MELLNRIRKINEDLTLTDTMIGKLVVCSEESEQPELSELEAGYQVNAHDQEQFMKDLKKVVPKTEITRVVQDPQGNMMLQIFGYNVKLAIRFMKTTNVDMPYVLAMDGIDRSTLQGARITYVGWNNEQWATLGPLSLIQEMKLACKEWFKELKSGNYKLGSKKIFRVPMNKGIDIPKELSSMTWQALREEAYANKMGKVLVSKSDQRKKQIWAIVHTNEVAYEYTVMKWSVIGATKSEEMVVWLQPTKKGYKPIHIAR